MTERRVIHTSMAPAPVGCYSQAVVENGFVFTAGQIPLDPATGKLVPGDFKKQVDQVLHNLNAVLSPAGTDLSRAVKLTVFVTDLKHLPEVNQVFEQCFAGLDPPARSALEVSALPGGSQIEIECIASL